MNTNLLTLMIKEDFESFFELLNNSFPSIERRNKEGQQRVFSESEYNVFVVKNDLKGIEAFIALWILENFIFIEHFAVKSQLRGNGIGSLILKEILTKFSNRKIFLEVEEPKDDSSRKRIKFYKSLGFKLNEFNYKQPPLQKQYGLLPLKIMSYPNECSREDFIRFRDEVYERVYRFNN